MSSSLSYHRWIIGSWFMLIFLIGSKIVNSQNSYLTPYGTYDQDDYIEINDHVKYNQPETYYYKYSHPVDNSNYENHLPGMNLPSYSVNYDYVSPSQDILNQKLLPSNEKNKNNNNNNNNNNDWTNEEIIDKMNLLEKLLSDDESNDEKEFEMKNSINDKINLDSIMTEDTKRVVRQVSKQKPGFFWTIAKVTFETFNDTISAIKQISSIVSNSIGPDTTTIKSTSSDSLMASSETLKDQNETTATMEQTTTESSTNQMPAITRSELQTLIVRNIKGLIRLFNIEWQDAIKQSDINANEFRKDLGKQVGMYLQDNPNAY